MTAHTGTDDYPYITAWGRMLGSFAGYVEHQREQARAESAPADAVHRDSTSGRWVTADEIWPADTRRRLGLQPLPPIAPDRAQLMQALELGVRSSMWLRDRNALHTVQAIGDDRLRLSFPAGVIAEVLLRLIPPS